jgi:hypothetical protein
MAPPNSKGGARPRKEGNWETRAAAQAEYKEKARIAAATHRSQGIANSEKNIEEKAAAKRRKAQVKAATAAAEARAAAAVEERRAKIRADPEYHWKQQLKVGEKHEKKRDYEEALAVYVETLAGFTAIGVERPNLAKKVADITRWIDEEATC